MSIFNNSESTDNTEVEKSQSNNVQVGACSCNDLQSDEEIKSLNEAVQLLGEDVLCISTVVSQLQKRMDNCTDVNTPHSKSNTNETSESRKASNYESCVIIPESPKSLERSVDLGVVETKENELHSISGDEM